MRATPGALLAAKCTFRTPSFAMAADADARLGVEPAAVGMVSRYVKNGG